MAVVAVLILAALLLTATCAGSRLLSFRRHSEKVLKIIETSLQERRNLVNQFLSNAQNFELDSRRRESLQDACRQADSAREIHERMPKEHLLSVALDAAFSSLSSEKSARLAGFKQSLKNLEGEINETARRYNQLARMFNSHVEHFPANIIARITGLKELAFFNL